MTKLYILILVLFLSGCGPTTKVFIIDPGETFDEKTTQPDAVVKQDTQGAVSYERTPDGIVKITVDTRKPTMWERFIQPVFKSAAQGATTQTNVN